MRQGVLRSTCLVLALLGTASLSAHSQTTLNGFVSGVEFCDWTSAGQRSSSPASPERLTIGRQSASPSAASFTMICQRSLAPLADITDGRWSIRALRPSKAR
jgi:hypothetical protein